MCDIVAVSEQSLELVWMINHLQLGRWDELKHNGSETS